jgi:hypothetical protein
MSFHLSELMIGLAFGGFAALILAIKDTLGRPYLVTVPQSTTYQQMAICPKCAHQHTLARLIGKEEIIWAVCPVCEFRFQTSNFLPQR